MKISIWNELTKSQQDFIMRRAEVDITAQMAVARTIAEDVRQNGDEALRRYTKKFDNAEVGELKVTAAEIEQGYNAIDGALRDAISYAAGNIKAFHEKQMPQSYFLEEVDKGLLVGEKVTPLQNVCLYVPRGKGSFPSVLLMLCVPALVAGVERIVVITPPNPEGNVDDAILAAAKITGITEIYKVGGIQSIAAVAYGTETIPKCLKVIGPGSSYVTAAKRVLSDVIDAGLPAGPSESIILCDENADPYKAALDLMIEAEHGSDSAALLVTHSVPLVSKVNSYIETFLEKVSEQRRTFITTNLNTYGGAIITSSLEESIDFTNMYAPEHMEILTRNPLEVLPKIKNAGEILLGEHTPITLGNYLLGLNAILPTGGFAKTHSGVSVHDFLKRSSIGYATSEGFNKVKKFAYDFATAEGFDSHALAVSERDLPHSKK